MERKTKKTIEDQINDITLDRRRCLLHIPMDLYKELEKHGDVEEQIQTSITRFINA